MYEHFTDRARKVMQLANSEACRLCHQYIETEHILLGLIKEASGVGFHALQKMEATEKVKITVGKMLSAGPDLITMGKLPQTLRSKKVIEFAMEESRAWNHNYVGTEHLLLGLLREEGGCAAQALNEHGVTLERAKTVVCELLKNRDGLNAEFRDAMDELKAFMDCPDATDTEVTRKALADLQAYGLGATFQLLVNGP